MIVSKLFCWLGFHEPEIEIKYWGVPRRWYVEKCECCEATREQHYINPFDWTSVAGKWTNKKISEYDHIEKR